MPHELTHREARLLQERVEDGSATPDEREAYAAHERRLEEALAPLRNAFEQWRASPAGQRQERAEAYADALVGAWLALEDSDLRAPRVRKYAREELHLDAEVVRRFARDAGDEEGALTAAALLTVVRRLCPEMEDLAWNTTPAEMEARHPAVFEQGLRIDQPDAYLHEAVRHQLGPEAARFVHSLERNARALERGEPAERRRRRWEPGPDQDRDKAIHAEVLTHADDPDLELGLALAEEQEALSDLAAALDGFYRDEATPRERELIDALRRHETPKAALQALGETGYSRWQALQRRVRRYRQRNFEVGV